MTKKRKISFIVYAILLVLIAAGFILLGYSIKNMPEVVCVQSSGEDKIYEKEDLYITMPIGKGWQDQGYHANQYEATVYNNTLNNIKDWSVTIQLPNNSFINDSWNVVYNENSDGTITISNDPEQGYNDYIAPGESITFGFILFSNSDTEIEDFVLKGVPEPKMTDYPVFYVYLFLLFNLIISFAVSLALTIKDRQYRIRQERDQKIIIQSMKTFTNFIDAKDPYTRGHSIRVAFYTKKLAQKLGFDEDELYNIYYIALLHDVGKINIPDNILNKPGPLTKEEMDVIKTHTTNGAAILKDFNSISSIIEGAMYHHERYDGTGYPEGLKGEDIPLVARIIGVADAFDAMNSNRCYRKAFDSEKIISELREGAGKQFDPDIVKIMLELIDKKAFANMDDELRDN